MVEDEHDAAAEDPRRAILEDVAAGRITPEEAAARFEVLDEADRAAGREPSNRGSGTTGAGPPLDRPVRSVRAVRISASAIAVRVVAVRSLDAVDVEGPHLLVMHGDTAVVTAGPFTDRRHPPAPTRAHEWRHGIGDFPFRWGFGGPLRVTIRVPEGIDVDADLTAGSLNITGPVGGVRCSVSAGSARIQGFDGPITAVVSAGSLTAAGRVGPGQSRVTCDAGSLRLHLERGSDVRVRAHASLGRADIELPSAPDGTYVVGDGRGTLEVTSNLGSLSVTADDHVQAWA